MATNEATLGVVCDLLTPVCSLNETCDLWRYFAAVSLNDDQNEQQQQSQLCWRSDECQTCCDRCWRCRGCRQRASQRMTSSATDPPPKYSPPRRGLRRSPSQPLPIDVADEAANVDDSSETRRSAYKSWLAKKSELAVSARRQECQLQQAEEEKRRDALKVKREEGAAAYESWLKTKRSQRSRAGRGEDAEANEEEKEAERKAETEAAIAKWRERKAEEARTRKRNERQKAQEEEEKEASKKAEKQEDSRKAMDFWLRRAAQSARDRRKKERKAEEEKQAKENDKEEKKENAKEAFLKWSQNKADAEESETPNLSCVKHPPWMPNSTLQRK